MTNNKNLYLFSGKKVFVAVISEPLLVHIQAFAREFFNAPRMVSKIT